MEPDTGVARPTSVRLSFLALLLALLGLTLLPTGGPASASCAAPYVEVPPVLAPGASAEVHGRGFVDGCRDSMSCPVGCNAGECEYDDPPPEPTKDVTLQLRQRGRTWDLGTADADDRGRVRWSFALPGGARPGRARLVWDGDPRGVQVTVVPTAG